MASEGKCKRCGRTVYALECMSAGPPGKKDVYHKVCFKCQNPGCSWQLTYDNYTYYEGEIFCKNHCPMKGFSNDKHAKGTIDTGSVAVKAAVTAPKRELVSEQIRGAYAGAPTAIGLDSMSVAAARDAPKLDTAKAQIVAHHFCSNCGTKSSGGSFCTQCGTQLMSYSMV